MKDIKKYYQDLIKDINLSNNKIVSGLNNHIAWLEKKYQNFKKNSRRRMSILFYRKRLTNITSLKLSAI